MCNWRSTDRPHCDPLSRRFQKTAPSRAGTLAADCHRNLEIAGRQELLSANCASTTTVRRNWSPATASGNRPASGVPVFPGLPDREVSLELQDPVIRRPEYCSTGKTIGGTP